MLTSRFRYIMVPVLALALAACASRPDPSVTSDPGAPQPATGTQSANAIRVTVNHTDMNRSELSVYIQPANGVRTLLGTLNSGEQKSFTFEASGTRMIRLIGISPSASQLESPQINVPAGAGVHWEVNANTVRVVR